MGLLFLYGYLYNLLGDSWCCGNYCWFTFALWSVCCLVSFQYFVIDHLVIATDYSPAHHETTTHLLAKSRALVGTTSGEVFVRLIP